MIEIIKELNIEVSKPNLFQAVVAKQYDMNTRFIKATIVDYGEKITIPNSNTFKVIINAERPDGEAKGFNGVINDDGTVTVPLHSWMLELVGTVTCDISVIDTAADDNKKLTTTSFTLFVEKASWGGDGTTSDTQGDVLIDILRRITALEQNGGGGALDVYDIDDYTYAVSDENGNVAFAITNEGEVQYAGKGEGGGTSVATTIDYTKCGLTVLYLQEQETGAYQAMIEAASPENNYEKLEKTFNYRLRTSKGTDKFSGTCKLKFQGSSSLRNQYPKYNLTFKAVEEAFVAKDAVSERNGEQIKLKSWGEQKKYCLKANWIDPSAARNVVNAKLWGEIVKNRCDKYKDEDTGSFVEGTPQHIINLAAAPNYGAIDGFPCVVILNGEFNGLYTFNIPKDGWMFGMGESLTEYVVGGEANDDSRCGFYAEPDVDEEDFAIEHIHDDAANETLIASFKAAVNAVKDAPKSADWETAVSPYFDIDSAIDYYIFTCCISGHDNLRKNILYATYGSTEEGVPDKWFMSAYDLDTTLGSNPYGTGLYPVKTNRTQFLEAATVSPPKGAKHRLFELIYHYSFDKLKTRYWELRNTVLSNENVWYMFNNFVNAIPKAIYNLDAERWADKRDVYKYPMPATTTANVENYMQYYRMHTALLDKEMEG